jgi:glyoxylase-like metal-dependent hydrolase (beta-lactamase superfamily II)
MVKKSTFVMVVVFAVVCAARAQDAKTVIDSASKAMGYDQLKSIEYSGPSGVEGTAMGQAQSAAKGWPHFTLKNFSRYLDLTAFTGQQSALRSRPAEADGQLAGGGGLAPQPEAQNTTATNPNGTFAQRLDVFLSPPGFLKLAAASTNATVTQRNVNGKRYRVVSFPVEQKSQSGIPYTLSGYIDEQNMLDRVETKIEDNLVGDMPVEQTFSGYKDFGGLKFPTRIVQTRAGLAWTDITVADAKANPAAPPPPPAPAGRGGQGGGGAGGAGRGAPPEGRGGGAAGGGAGAGGGGRGGAPATVAAKKLADGIYLIAGGYRSIAVEMRDHVVLLEAPQSEMTTTAIIAEVKKTIPNKPIRYVINTHSHADHSGGLRAAAAEGITVMTHESNKVLYEKWFSNPRTLMNPDALSKSEKKAKFEYVGEKKVLKDSMNTIELYRIKAAHSEDMLVAYLPKIKAVYESDAFNPPAANAAPPQNVNGLEKLLADKLDEFKIDYTTIISCHQPAGGDRDVTKADLLRNIGKGN